MSNFSKLSASTARTQCFVCGKYGTKHHMVKMEGSKLSVHMTCRKKLTKAFENVLNRSQQVGVKDE